MVVAEQVVARRNDTAVKVDAEIARKAKIVAAYRDVSLAEYLSKALKDIVDADLKEEQDKERGGHPGRKPPKN